jgi:signal transduction histidine kinase
VNRIIGEHGGTIQFASEVGVGTRFTITLPLPAVQRSAALIDLSAYRSSAS